MEEKQINEVTFEEEGIVEQQPAEEHPMNALMEDALSLRRLQRGDIVEGTIVSVSPTEVLVDVGAKSEGVVPSRELERLGRDGLEELEVGSQVAVYVVRPEDRDGNLILSLRRAEEEQDWRKAQQLHESSDSFASQVAGFNKGGLIVRLGRLRGFVPASQLSPKHQGSNKQEPEERWARLVGADDPGQGHRDQPQAQATDPVGARGDAPVARRAKGQAAGRTCAWARCGRRRQQPGRLWRLCRPGRCRWPGPSFRAVVEPRRQAPRCAPGGARGRRLCPERRSGQEAHCPEPQAPGARTVGDRGKPLLRRPVGRRHDHPAGQLWRLCPDQRRDRGPDPHL